MPAEETPRQKKQASNPDKLRFNRRKVEKILVDDLAQFRVLLPGAASHDREDSCNLRIEQAFAQNALPHHP